MAGVLNKNIRKVTRRGKGGYKEKDLTIFSTNAAGLRNKSHSFKNELNVVNAGIFTIQETHFKKKGTLKVKDFDIFEVIREKQKGGTMIGVHKSLNPMLITEYNKDFELLVVEIDISKHKIRIVSGYGPQENWSEQDRLPFFLALEEEVIKAEMDGKDILIQMDANSKLGPEMIKGDPHIQTPNGKLLAQIVKRNDLKVINGIQSKCKGIITRRRETKDNVEESIIDFVITNDILEKRVESLLIDEKRNHVLTKITKTKKGVIKKESDHHPMITKLKFQWDRNMKKERYETFNFRNIECQEKFKEETTKTKELSTIVSKDKDLNSCTKKFLKRLNGFIHSSFKKIRISNKIDTKIENLMNLRRNLKNKEDNDSINKLKKVEEELADRCAEDNRRKILEEVKGIECEDGGVNSGKLWKLRKKLCPKSRDPPTAMLDSGGNLVTSKVDIDNIALETFKKRLENRKIKDGLEEIKNDKEILCKKRLEEAKTRKTSPWTIKDLETVLKYLKKNKSPDPNGYINELFRIDVIGEDLKVAILILMNRIKEEQKYPEILEVCDITPIFKRKGNRNDFSNYRGIFRVSIFRSILDRLIYNDEYQVIDSNLTDSNVGARKGRNIRDNVFVINAITNSVVKGKEEPIDVQVYDVATCFDSLWLHECINDVFDAGFQNDKLPLLFLENKTAKVAVKTAQGKSKRININNIIMQGSVWGSILCTTSIDKLGQLVYEDENLIYKYKGKVSVPSIAMVDDVLVVQRCSKSSTQINSVVNSFMELKKLTLNERKCSKIHIGKTSLHCPQLKIHGAVMKESEQEKYLGDKISKAANIKATIHDRVTRGYGIVSEINAILEDIPLGIYRVEMGLKLRQAMLINGLLFNSEAWHSVTKDDTKNLEKIDEMLIRSLMGSHMKTPLEFLYLETGAVPISYIISMRRIIYLRTIMMREEHELTKRILREQEQNSCPGDFIELVKSDFQKMGRNYDENFITKTTTVGFKNTIKSSMKRAAFIELKNMQRNHSKISKIKYENFECQEYLSSGMFTNEEISVLSSLRSHTLRTIRCNFKNLYKSNLHCPLKCWPAGAEPMSDTQQHILLCSRLNQTQNTTIASSTVIYENIYGDKYSQKAIIGEFIQRMSIRNRIIQEENELTSERAPITTLDPSTGLCYMDTQLCL